MRQDTDLVTVGIGVNDDGFAFHAAYECIVLAKTDPAAHRARTRTQDKLPAGLERMQGRLEDVFEAIAQRAPNARILAVGYPRCSRRGRLPQARLPLAKGDLDFVRQRGIRAAERDDPGRRRGRPDVEFVDVAAASEGHDICSDEPWINGDRKDRRTKAAPYHPTPEEQAAVAQMVLDLL